MPLQQGIKVAHGVGNLVRAPCQNQVLRAGVAPIVPDSHVEHDAGKVAPDTCRRQEGVAVLPRVRGRFDVCWCVSAALQTAVIEVEVAPCRVDVRVGRAEHVQVRVVGALCRLTHPRARPRMLPVPLVGALQALRLTGAPAATAILAVLAVWLLRVDLHHLARVSRGRIEVLEGFPGITVRDHLVLGGNAPLQRGLERSAGLAQVHAGPVRGRIAIEELERSAGLAQVRGGPVRGRAPQRQRDPQSAP
mmetsp:Transcript_39545/g.102394  ORF Transcript_39545/g.102394 Transcript_39545/m.102394 type:complete len:248 (-) Transcript_39545:118-861(-)